MAHFRLITSHLSAHKMKEIADWLIIGPFMTGINFSIGNKIPSEKEQTLI